MRIPQPLTEATSWAGTLEEETYSARASPHLQALGRWVKSKVSSRQDAEDIVQETHLLALRHFGQFRNEASFGTWLCSIALNVIRARIRRPEYKRTVLTQPQDFANWEPKDQQKSSLAILEQKEVRNRLHRAISSLPDLYRVVIEMRDLNGLTIRETANSLKVSRAAVKSRHYRAKGLLLKFYTKAESHSAV